MSPVRIGACEVSSYLTQFVVDDERQCRGLQSVLPGHTSGHEMPERDSAERSEDLRSRVHGEVRRVRADEGPVLRAVRLAALLEAPSAFGSSYATEVDLPASHWASRASLGASGERSVTYFAFVDQSVVGMVGGYRPDPVGSSIELVSMWVSPSQRRAGIAAELVQAVLDWANETGATTVELWVTRGNDAAVRLYEAAGFRHTGEHQPLPSDPCKDELRMRCALR